MAAPFGLLPFAWDIRVRVKAQKLPSQGARDMFGRCTIEPVLLLARVEAFFETDSCCEKSQLINMAGSIFTHSRRCVRRQF